MIVLLLVVKNGGFLPVSSVSICLHSHVFFKKLSISFEAKENDLNCCPITTYDKKGGLTLAVLPPVTHFVTMRVEFIGSR